YTRRWMRAYRPGQFNNAPYQFYPIGPDVGHLLGTGVAMQLGTGPQKAYQGSPVFGFTGDAGIAYSIMEIDTLSKYKIPAIINVQSSRQFLTNAFPPGAQPRNVEPGVTAYSH